MSFREAKPDEGLYQIRIQGIFESAHYLYGYYPDGSDEELHGHTWEVEVFIKTKNIKNGISTDFLDIRKKFDAIVKDLDHVCLNGSAPFKEVNPTAENIARFICFELKDSVKNNALISEVRVWEGPKNYASFFPKM